MLSKKHFVFQANVLGHHIIPMCIIKDQATGKHNWSQEKVDDYLELGRIIVNVCLAENPNFDLDKFNSQLQTQARQSLHHRRLTRLIHDLPCLALTYHKFHALGIAKERLVE